MLKKNQHIFFLPFMLSTLNSLYWIARYVCNELTGKAYKIVLFIIYQAILFLILFNGDKLRE